MASPLGRVRASRAGTTLVGREVEQRVLRSLRTDGGHRGVLLYGGVGVGVTRLGLDYLDSWQAAGAETLRLMSSRSSARLPLGVLAAFLPDHVEVDVPPARQTDLLRRCLTTLAELAGDRRIVLMVDNVHLLDDVSAMLVHQLVESTDAFLIATVTRGEPLPEPIEALRRDESIVRLDVVELTDAAMEQLVGGLLGGPVDKGLVAELTRLCAGDLHYLHELVQGGLRDGTVAPEVGLWRQVGQLSPTPRLAELVEARLTEVGGEERALLELVAFGEPLAAEDLAAQASTAVVERLDRQGLLVFEAGRTGLAARLSCPVHGMVLRAHTPALRRRDIIRTLLAAGSVREPGTLLRLAAWQLESGGGDPGLMGECARVACERGDLALAETLAGAGRPGFETDLLLARIVLSGPREEAGEATLREMLANAPDDRRRYDVASVWMDTLTFVKGRVSASVRVAALAEQLMTEPAVRQRIADRRAVLTAVRQGASAALPIASSVFERSTGETAARTAVATACGFLHVGRPHEALRAAERGHAAHLSAEAELGFGPGIHLVLRAAALARSGRIEAAYTLALAQYRRGVLDADLELQAWFAMALCMLAPERGCARSAAMYGRASVALFRRMGRPRLEAMARNHLVHALALAGQGREARSELAAVRPEDQVTALVGDRLQARAWTLVAEDEQSSAVELLGRAAELAQAAGDVVGELSALHSMARLGGAARVLGRAEELGVQVDGELAGHRIAHIRALVESQPEDLGRVSDAFERAGALLLAAEAAAQSAEAWGHRGHTRRAARAAYRSGTVAQRCEEPALPALRPARQTWLTPAEREVAVRAASGRSNKCIADELYISRRIVEKQLEHVYGKLGIAGRRELSAVLGCPH